MDKICINGLRVFARHGVNPEEKEKGQPFILDIEISADLRKPCESDRVEDTVNYSAALRTAVGAMSEGPFNLIERAAQHVADELLKNYPKIESVRVRLYKPRAPIAADFGSVAVEIIRNRK